MLIDTLPATHQFQYQHQPASAEVKDQWVQARLIGVLMDRVGPGMLLAWATLLLTIFLLIGEVEPIRLAIWVIFMVAMLIYRYHMVATYRMRYNNIDGPLRQAFVDRYLWTWAVTGACWGSVASITYLQVSFSVQFILGLVMMGLGIFALTTFGSYRPAFRYFVNGLVVALVVSVTFNAALQHPELNDWKRSTVLLVLISVFWRMMIIAGNHLHDLYMSSYELQFSNEELIESLTQQTKASMRAVTAKNRFLASAAHDLRQPVHALSLYADWLVTEPEMSKDIAPRMLQSTRAINELFDSLFDLTRIDAGNYKVRLQMVDVPTLLDNLHSQFAPVAAAKYLSLRTYTKPRVVWADPVVLKRLLSNLVSNALKHTQIGGVLVGLRQTREALVFEVWDTGVGIAHEHQMAIFQEFFRVSQHQGTEDSLGLGLTIVSKLSSMMGYQLAVSSQEGRGSVFRIMLPAFTQTVRRDEPVLPEILLNSRPADLT